MWVMFFCYYLAYITIAWMFADCMYLGALNEFKAKRKELLWDKKLS